MKPVKKLVENTPIDTLEIERNIQNAHQKGTNVYIKAASSYTTDIVNAIYDVNDAKNVKTLLLDPQGSFQTVDDLVQVLDSTNNKPTVVVLDEFNRFAPDNRRIIEQLIATRTVADAKYSNILFFVLITIPQPKISSDAKLSPSVLSRFPKVIDMNNTLNSESELSESSSCKNGNCASSYKNRTDALDSFDDVNEAIDYDHSDPIPPESNIVDYLNRAYGLAKRAMRRGKISKVNVLLKGQASTGKTETTMAWCKANDVQMIMLDPSTFNMATMSVAFPLDGDDKMYALLTPECFNKIKAKPTIIFLDELPRFDNTVAGFLMKFVNEHKYQENDYRKTLLFCVAAGNYGKKYNQSFKSDAAQTSRWAQVDVKIDYYQAYDNIVADYEDEIEDTKKRLQDPNLTPEERQECADIINGDIAKEDIATILLKPSLGRYYKLPSPTDAAGDTYKRLMLDDEGTEKDREKFDGSTTSRSLKAALDMCDGTTDDFIDHWNSYCDPADYELMYYLIQEYEHDYVDIDDKANSVFKNQVKADGTPFAPNLNGRTRKDQIVTKFDVNKRKK